MRGYCWRYFAVGELENFLGQEKRQVYDQTAELIRRGLLVRVYAPGAVEYPYMRPSDDLFRVCIKATMMCDMDYLRTIFDGGRVTPTEHREYRDACRAVLIENRDAMHELLQAFVTSEAEDRAAVFCAGYNALAERYWPLPPRHGGKSNRFEQ